jgi:hypothetical protein
LKILIIRPNVDGFFIFRSNSTSFICSILVEQILSEQLVVHVR